MSSLGETQLEELSSTTNSSIPVATADVLQDPNEMIDDDQTDAGYYEMMEEIINQESSGDEGKSIIAPLGLVFYQLAKRTFFVEACFCANDCVGVSGHRPFCQILVIMFWCLI